MLILNKNHLKKACSWLPALWLLCTVPVHAQTADELVAAGRQAETAKKESEALTKYKEALKLQPTDTEALCRASILSSREGNRQTDRETKESYYEAARIYAEAALKQAPASDTANLAMAIALDRLALISGVKEKVAYFRDMKKYTDLALKINPRNAEAWYVLGQWNYQVGNMNFAERAAAKMLFGGIPDASVEKAIAAYGKCRELDPSFIPGYYELAVAYHENGHDLKAIEALKQALRRRSIRQDDDKIKEQCKQLLASLQ